MKCFNLYKMGYEQSLSESYALNHMKFSPRLFEIKLSQRCETVAYFHDCDTFVLAEGEAALSFNFHTGIQFVHHRVFYQRFSMALGLFMISLSLGNKILPTSE